MPHNMRKSFYASHKGAFVLVALLFVCAAFAAKRFDLGSTRYFIKERPLKVETASREGEALIIVASSAQGWRGSKLEVWGAVVGEAFGIVTDTPEPLRGTLTLIRLRPTTGTDVVAHSRSESSAADLGVERLGLSKLPTWGKLFAEGRELYYVAGYGAEEGESEDDGGPADAAAKAKAWRWDGKEFAAIGDDVAAQIGERAWHRSQANKSEPLSLQARDSVSPDGDWKLTEGFLRGGTSDVGSFDLAGERWRLLAVGLSPAGDGAGTLSLMSGRIWRATLASFSGDWAETDAAYFESLHYEGLDKIAGSYFGRQLSPNALTMIFWLALAAALPYFWVRRTLSRSVGHVCSYPDARPEHFPYLDRDRLDTLNAVLESRGFTHLRDYTLVSSNNTLPTRPLSFARLFAHPELHIYAEVAQIFGTKHTDAKMCFSVLTRFEQDWRIGVTDRTPNPVTYLLRRPKGLWLARPGATPAEILGWHMNLREQMITTLDLKVCEDASAEAYFRMSSEAAQELRRRMQRRSRRLISLLFEHSRLKAHRRYEWLGDYGLRDPSEWVRPAEADGASATGFGRMRAIAAAWATPISLIANVFLLMSCVLFLLNSTHSLGALYFRLCFCALGMFLSFLPNMLGVKKS